jgi:hypothetical protein
MKWIKVRKSPGSANSNDDATVLSRRDVLAGIGFAGMFAVAGATLLAASPAEARVDRPAAEPEAAPADAGEADAAECKAPEGDLADLDTSNFTEVSAQRRRRGYYGRRGFYGPRRRYWRRRRRRYWRRARVVCRRRWYRGRIVRVCRRVWW